jgi:hypothetical protein
MEVTVRGLYAAIRRVSRRVSDCLRVNSCGQLVSDYCGPNDGNVPFLAPVLETVLAGGRYTVKRSLWRFPKPPPRMPLGLNLSPTNSKLRDVAVTAPQRTILKDTILLGFVVIIAFVRGFVGIRHGLTQLVDVLVEVEVHRSQRT